MSERTEYTPAHSADRPRHDRPGGSQAFYNGLFGWESQDLPVGDGVYYSMQQLRGKNVAAIAPQPEQQRDAGAPPSWNSYVTVENATPPSAREGARRRRARPAFDVDERRRMAVLQDPQGAYFMVWEPRETIGAGIVTEPARSSGTSSTRRTSTPPRRSTAGSSGGPVRLSDIPSRTSRCGWATGQRGITRLTARSHPYWLVYFGTTDIDASIAKVESSAARSCSPRSTSASPGSRVTDPQGAAFALYDGQLDD